MKTHSGAKKRFFVTGTGKVRHYHSGHSHRLRNKDAARRRRLKKDSGLAEVLTERVKALIPYK
ncbi:MAG: 50S ribosomal protein L35 [Bacillota bacterium]